MNEQVRAIIVIGSHARKERKADQWSDIDVILFTTHPQRYQQEEDWLREIGPTLSSYNGLEVAESTFVKRVFFEDGVSIDVTPVKAATIDWVHRYALLKTNLPSFLGLWPASVKQKIEKPIRGLCYYLHRGLLILVDKGDYGMKLALIENAFRYVPQAAPDLKTFERQVNEFWQNAFRMAVKLSRKELFTAKIECEGPMKLNLLTLIEWHAKCLKGWDLETWHKGRYLEKWADPKTIEEVQTVYGRYDERDAWTSLFNTMKLFERVSGEIDGHLGLNYDRNPEQRIQAWVRELYFPSGSDVR